MQAKRDQAAAVERAVTRAKRWQYKRDNKRWKKHEAAAVKAAEQRGYSSGNSAGYSAGTSAGYTSGRSDGIDEGIDTASDELTCSDDLDVPLPFCDF